MIYYVSSGTLNSTRSYVDYHYRCVFNPSFCLSVRPSVCLSHSLPLFPWFLTVRMCNGSGTIFCVHLHALYIFIIYTVHKISLFFCSSITPKGGVQARVIHTLESPSGGVVGYLSFGHAPCHAHMIRRNQHLMLRQRPRGSDRLNLRRTRLL